MASTLEVMETSDGEVMARLPIRLPPTLIKLSNEVMINILQWLPQTSLSTLVQTCIYFRQFIQAFGMSICNNQLLALYPKYFELLEVQQHASGWLVATSPWFFNAELAIQRDLHVSYGLDFPIPGYIHYHPDGRISQPSPSFSSALQLISLLSPGPQLLAFLDQHSLALRASYKQMVMIEGKSRELWLGWVTHYAIQRFLKCQSKFAATAWYLAPMFVKSDDLIIKAEAKAKVTAEADAKADSQGCGESGMQEVSKFGESSTVSVGSQLRRSQRLKLKK